MTWTVVKGCVWRKGGVEVRAEPGDVVQDVPVKAAQNLEKRGAIVREDN